MITVTIKGRISNVRFLENEGAEKVRDGQYLTYQVPVADEAAAVALCKRIEGDGYAWEGYEKCWCEWTSPELEAEIAAELAEDCREPLYAGWASIAEKLQSKGMNATNEDCYLVVLDQLEELERKMYRKRADTRRVRAITRELNGKSSAAAAAHYTTAMPAKAMPQRSNSGNRSARRYTGGAPRTWRKVQLREPDAALLDGVLGGLAIDEALRRLAASAAADADTLRAALAPHLADAAWNEEVL